MRNLELRVERLERQVASTAACYCWAVVHDEEQETQGR
jgi:hypothetical protein